MTAVFLFTRPGDFFRAVARVIPVCVTFSPREDLGGTLVTGFGRDHATFLMAGQPNTRLSWEPFGLHLPLLLSLIGGQEKKRGPAMTGELTTDGEDAALRMTHFGGEESEVTLQVARPELSFEVLQREWVFEARVRTTELRRALKAVRAVSAQFVASTEPLGDDLVLMAIRGVDQEEFSLHEGVTSVECEVVRAARTSTGLSVGLVESFLPFADMGGEVTLAVERTWPTRLSVELGRTSIALLVCPYVTPADEEVMHRRACERARDRGVPDLPPPSLKELSSERRAFEEHIEEKYG